MGGRRTRGIVIPRLEWVGMVPFNGNIGEAMMKRTIAAAVVGVCVLGMGMPGWAEGGRADAGDGKGDVIVERAPALKPTTEPATTAVKKSKVGVIHLSQRLKERPASFQIGRAHV